MMNPESVASGMGTTGEPVAGEIIRPNREEMLRRFFLGRLEYLLHAQKVLAEHALSPAEDLLLKRSIYSTFGDCVALEAGDEARRLLAG